MDGDFGSNFISIEDEDGNEFELEQVASLEYKETEYSLFLPADMEETDPDYGYIILKLTEEDGEELFNSVDDEDELNTVYELFMAMLFGDDGKDEGGDE